MIVQNDKVDNVIKTTALKEDDVIKTTTFEDVIEFNTKENAVDYAYVTIATVYMPGQTWCHVQEDAAKLGGGERAQIGQSAGARSEERLHGNKEWKLVQGSSRHCGSWPYIPPTKALCAVGRGRGTWGRSNVVSPEL